MSSSGKGLGLTRASTGGQEFNGVHRLAQTANFKMQLHLVGVAVAICKNHQASFAYFFL
jgi:hypothetical protein